MAFQFVCFQLFASEIRFLSSFEVHSEEATSGITNFRSGTVTILFMGKDRDDGRVWEDRSRMHTVL
jgi:hypothetical protein